jgi:hypothetical protein
VDKEQIQSNLEILTEKWDRFTDVPDIPDTTLQIIEYSLDKQRKAEIYASRILAYFLDPSESHGLSTEFLQTFLSSLPSDVEFEEETFELSDVQVTTEAPVSLEEDHEGEEQVRGYADLFIELPEEWFVVCEIKLGASERGIDSKGRSQTELYYDADRVNGELKSDYGGGGYYLYIRPGGSATAKEEEFTNLSWQYVTSVVDTVLNENAARFPSRPVGQLREFKDDIQILTGMSEEQQHEQELAALYVEHYNAVNEVTTAFEEQWEEFMDTWWQDLSSQLDPASISEWHDREGNDWAYLFKHGWWRHAETLEPIQERDGDYNTIRVGFHHRMTRNLDTALEDHELRFYFRNPPPNRHSEYDDTNFRDMFNEKFENQKEAIKDALPQVASLTGNTRNLIEATYTIPVDKSDEFTTAYLEAVERAFREHAVDNEQLVNELDQIYEECIAEIEP